MPQPGSIQSSSQYAHTNIGDGEVKHPILAKVRYRSPGKHYEKAAASPTKILRTLIFKK